MKLYCFYLIIQDSVSEARPDVLSYVNSEYRYEFLSSLNALESKRWDEEHGVWLLLYAHTNQKWLADWFEEIHNMKWFHKTVRKITQKEFDMFHKENIFSTIQNPNELLSKKEEERIINGGSSNDDWKELYSFAYATIPVTSWENSLITEDIPMILESNLAEGTINYQIFNDSLIKELDCIGYCNSYASLIETDDYYYQASYGVSMEGFFNLRIMYNYMISYIELFYPILKLSKEGE